ncbi:hypothetical protein MRB53_039366 [Persea americana]|nr:hypothetical protein MRB53_039366 [Persea americana]
MFKNLARLPRAHLISSRFYPFKHLSTMSNTTQPAKIAVFCGAKSGAEGEAGPPVQAAKALAQQFHRHGAHLVYGGGTHGVMGTLAMELVKLSGPESVLGIIP